jgi:hypothetical protein
MAEDIYGAARRAGWRAGERLVRDLMDAAPGVGDGHYGAEYARAAWVADALAAAVATVDGERRHACRRQAATWNAARDASAADVDAAEVDA